MAGWHKYPLSSLSIVIEFPGLTGYMCIWNKDYFPPTPPPMRCEWKPLTLLLLGMSSKGRGMPLPLSLSTFLQPAAWTVKVECATWDQVNENTVEQPSSQRGVWVLDTLRQPTLGLLTHVCFIKYKVTSMSCKSLYITANPVCWTIASLSQARSRLASHLRPSCTRSVIEMTSTLTNWEALS